MFYYPVDPCEKYGVFAVRMGKYKAHYYTRGEFWLRLMFCTKTVNSKKKSVLFGLLYTRQNNDVFLRIGTQWNHSRSGLSGHLPPAVPRPSTAV